MVMPKKLKTQEERQQEANTFTIREAAKYLNISERTLFRYIKASEVKAQKVCGMWRIKKEDILTFCDDGTDIIIKKEEK